MKKLVVPAFVLAFGMSAFAGPRAEKFKVDCYSKINSSEFNAQVISSFPSVAEAQKALPFVTSFSEIHAKLLKLQCEQLATFIEN